MSMIELKDSKGRSHRFYLYEIGGPIDIGESETKNGILITTKAVNDGWEVIDMTTTGESGARPYFGSWDRKNDNGTWQHVSRHLGATHLAVLQVDLVFGDELRDVYQALIGQQDTLLSKELRKSAGSKSA